MVEDLTVNYCWIDVQLGDSCFGFVINPMCSDAVDDMYHKGAFDRSDGDQCE